MVAKLVEKVTGSFEQKRQYRQQVARIEALPEPYRAAAQAVQRYVTHEAGVVDGESIVAMLRDSADLWERAAAAGAPLAAVVGDDPVAFAETFAQGYDVTRWDGKERTRLAAAFEGLERRGNA
jgi:DNA-binding ferritin-like protein (Dps family)